MPMTLAGRLQTRLVLSSSIGLLWTLAITPLLPRPAGAPLSVAFQITLASSILMTLLGILWELVYHALQQLRWDKDWPVLLGLVTSVTEAIPVWIILRALEIPQVHRSAFLPLFAVHFGTTWIVIWLASLGPIAVVQPRWRFEGGTFSRRPTEALVPFVVTNFGMSFALVILWFVWP
jgi:hypothetical protein